MEAIDDGERREVDPGEVAALVTDGICCTVEDDRTWQACGLPPFSKRGVFLDRMIPRTQRLQEAVLQETAGLVLAEFAGFMFMFSNDSDSDVVTVSLTSSIERLVESGRWRELRFRSEMACINFFHERLTRYCREQFWSQPRVFAKSMVWRLEEHPVHGQERWHKAALDTLNEESAFHDYRMALDEAIVDREEGSTHFTARPWKRESLAVDPEYVEIFAPLLNLDRRRWDPSLASPVTTPEVEVTPALIG